MRARHGQGRDGRRWIEHLLRGVAPAERRRRIRDRLPVDFEDIKRSYSALVQGRVRADIVITLKAYGGALRGVNVRSGREAEE